MPQFDIDEDLIIGTDITEKILSLYTNYPCFLKATVLVLCRNGRLNATINANLYNVKKNDFVILPPNTIFQLHHIEDNPKLYFMVFSSNFMEKPGIIKSIIDFLYILKNNPVISLPEPYAELYEDFFKPMVRLHELTPQIDPTIAKSILYAILIHMKEIHQTRTTTLQKNISNRNQQIYYKFRQLAQEYYIEERNIAFYAEKIGITPTHLSNTVKQISHKTVMDLISELVINHAKAKLKTTSLSIQEIALSLNFPNASFFGKYFKRYTGMSPLNYRNS